MYIRAKAMLPLAMVIEQMLKQASDPQVCLLFLFYFGARCLLQKCLRTSTRPETPQVPSQETISTFRDHSLVASALVHLSQICVLDVADTPQSQSSEHQTRTSLLCLFLRLLRPLTLLEKTITTSVM